MDIIKKLRTKLTLGLVGLTLASILATPASAVPDKPPRLPRPRPPRNVPEIDAKSIGLASALMVGGILIYHEKKKKLCLEE